VVGVVIHAGLGSYGIVNTKLDSIQKVKTLPAGDIFVLFSVNSRRCMSVLIYNECE